MFLLPSHSVLFVALTLIFFSMDCKIIVWYIQGPCGGDTNRVLRNLVDSHRPAIVVLLEPRISGDQANWVISSLRFECSLRVEARGFSGGIWVVWRDFVWIDIIENHMQFVHMFIKIRNIEVGFFTTIYGSPNRVLRRSLWVDLVHISVSMNDRWLLAGDFNVLLAKSEWMGHRGMRSRACSDFGDFVQGSSLLDLRF